MESVKEAVWLHLIESREPSVTYVVIDSFSSSLLSVRSRVLFGNFRCEAVYSHDWVARKTYFDRLF
jgi:hypothetical protein